MTFELWSLILLYHISIACSTSAHLQGIPHRGTPELSNTTQLKCLTEASAPIPASGIIFLLLVGVDPAGLPTNRRSQAQSTGCFY